MAPPRKSGRAVQPPPELYAAGTVLRYQSPQGQSFAVVQQAVQVGATEITVETLQETKKRGRYQVGGAGVVLAGNVVAVVSAVKKGKTVDIDEKDIPEESDLESEGSAEEEEPQQAKVKPARKQPPSKVKSPPAVKPGKSQLADSEPDEGDRRRSTRKIAKKPVYKDDSSDEEETGKKGKRRRGKSESDSSASSGEEVEEKRAKGRSQKPSKKPKLRTVPTISVLEELESPGKDLITRCCAACTDRNVLRAALTRNKALMDKLFASEKLITSVQKVRGPEVSRTAIDYAVQAGDDALVLRLLKEIETPQIKKRKRTETALEWVDTGHVSREAFGVAVRQVNVSRGNRQGNNAFLSDEYVEQDESQVLENAIKRGAAPALLDSLIARCANSESTLSRSIGDAVRTGELKFALRLMSMYRKNGGYGVNDLHEAVLKKGKLPQMKKVSIVKKLMQNYQITPIHCACINPDAQHLKELIGMVDDINIEDKEKWKLVHYAAVCTTAEPLKVLLSHGANYNDTTSNKTAPLMLAAKRNRAQVAEFLLANGANVDMKNRKGKAALHYAAQYAALDALEVLLKYATKKTLEMPGNDRMTPLIVASTKGHKEVVERLLAAGASVKKRDKYKRTALAMAAKNGHADIASVLLAHGADPNLGDSSKNTPLHYSCAYGWWQCTDLLLQCGADVNAGNDWKLPPLIVTLMKGHLGLLKKLLEVPGVDVNCKDEEGRTLLSRSIDILSKETIAQMKDLLENKQADPNIADLNGLTPLHHLAALSKPKYKGEKTDKEGRMTYIDSQWNLQTAVAEMLLSHGAVVDSVAADGRTPLVLALRSRNTRLCALFLANGADAGVVMKDGGTALHAAASFGVGMEKVIRELLQRAEVCAKINNVDDKGFTPVLRLCRQYEKTAKRVYQDIRNDLREEMGEALKKEVQSSGGRKPPENDYIATLQGKALPKQKAEDSEDEGEQLSVPDDECGSESGGEKDSENSDEYDDSESDASVHSEKDQDTEENYLFQIDEKVLNERSAEAMKVQVEEFGDLLILMEKCGADCKLPVGKLKKYRDDPTLIMSESEAAQGKAKGSDLGSDRGSDDSEKKDCTYFITDFDGTVRWREYGKHGLKGVLHFLLGYSHPSVIERALTLQLLLDQRNFEGDTALQVAVAEKHATGDVEVILQRGADANVRNCKGRTPLCAACEVGKSDLVPIFIAHKAMAEILDVDGSFPLKIAVEKKDSDTLRELLEHGANPNFSDGKQRTALHHAFNSADVTADASFDIESLLLESGGDINLRDIRGRTPLHYAFVKIGNPDLDSKIDPVEAVSSACSMKGVDANVRDAWGRTPMHYAAQRGAVTSGMMMVEAGAVVGVQDNDGNTELCTAIAHSHSDFATMLLQHRFDITVPVVVTKKIKEKKKSSESEDSDGYYGRKKRTNEKGLPVGTYSPFRAAVRLDWLGVAYLLLMRGYDYMLAMQDALNEKKFKLCLTLLAKVTDSAVLRRTNKDGQNLFHTLAIHGSAAKLQDTNALGAKLHIRKVDHLLQDKNGCLPLHLACASHYIPLISYLLNLGADPNARDSSGRSALVHAVDGPKVLKCLTTLKALTGADVNVRFTNSDGVEVTPLLHAVMQSASKETVLFLLQAGADIAATDSRGRTLLMHAIIRNSAELVEAVLAWPGTDLTVVDNKGWSTAHYVVSPLEFGSYENEGLMQKLAAAGAELKTKDKEGHTPYWYAAKQRSGKMRKALEKLGAKEPVTADEPEAPFHPQTEVDYNSDFEAFLAAKAETMEIANKREPDPEGDFPLSYEVIDDFDLLMVRVDLAYGPFSAYLFYRMQLLRDKNRDVFVVYTRWGRIGETGASQRTPFTTRADGEAEFKKIFKEKTKNEWGEPFTHVKGKYRILPMKEKSVKHQQFLQAFEAVKAPPPQVGTEVQEVIKQLTESNVYKSVFDDNSIDVNVLNFSNIGKSDLEQAEQLLYQVGATIQELQKEGNTVDIMLECKERLFELSSRFYEIIPMTTFVHSAINPIQSESDLSAKLDLLITLRHMGIASKIIIGAQYRQDSLSPYDYCYFSLRMMIHPLPQESPEYRLLEMYARNGGNSMKLRNIFRIEREGETERIRKYEKVKNRMLLWHGSSLCNMIGIFTQGLRIAPPEAPATGYMFGKGLYFADHFSKSANYCSSHSSTQLMLLAEVVIGRSLEKFENEYITKLPKDYLSTKGMGRIGPDFSQNVTMADGVVVPCGEEMKYKHEQRLWLQHNEYIVYDTSQVRLRYLLELSS